jgi:hypothetical protein
MVLKNENHFLKIKQVFLVKLKMFSVAPFFLIIIIIFLVFGVV